MFKFIVTALAIYALFCVAKRLRRVLNKINDLTGIFDDPSDK